MAPATFVTNRSAASFMPCLGTAASLLPGSPCHKAPGAVGVEVALFEVVASFWQLVTPQQRLSPVFASFRD
jgi:hypothetical protein